MKQQNFWKTRIIDWEERSYRGTSATSSIIEAVADFFRGHLRKRQDFAFNFVLQHQPLCVLELGCGSGILTEKLLKAGIPTVFGVDFAGDAIELATTRLQRYVAEGRARFDEAAVRDLDFSQFAEIDFVIGMGLTPYLENDEFANLFRFIADSNRLFLFDYHLRGLTVLNSLHAIYRRLTPFPFYRTFSKSELIALTRRYGIAIETTTVDQNSYMFRRSGE